MDWQVIEGGSPPQSLRNPTRSPLTAYRLYKCTYGAYKSTDGTDKSTYLSVISATVVILVASVGAHLSVDIYIDGGDRWPGYLFML